MNIKKYIEDHGLIDLSGDPIPVNKDGTVTLVHRTSMAEARSIYQMGKFVGSNEIHFSTKAKGHIEYGKGIVVARVPLNKIHLNDAHRHDLWVSVYLWDFKKKYIVKEKTK
jgi:hypothetical protein